MEVLLLLPCSFLFLSSSWGFVDEGNVKKRNVYDRGKEKQYRVQRGKIRESMTGRAFSTLGD